MLKDQKPDQKPEQEQQQNIVAAAFPIAWLTGAVRLLGGRGAAGLPGPGSSFFFFASCVLAPT